MNLEFIYLLFFIIWFCKIDCREDSSDNQELIKKLQCMYKIGQVVLKLRRKTFTILDGLIIATIATLQAFF